MSAPRGSDPDGSAVRLALNRKVTVNSMAAGEKLFVDLLPEGWTGLPPGLPQEVVEELARRAREAEKKARQQLAVAQQRALPPVRVRVGVQPTFTRYTFALPGLIAVSTNRVDDQDDIHVRGAAQVRSRRRAGRAAADGRGDRRASEAATPSSVRFDFIGKVDVRTFREDNNYVVDVVPIAARGEAAAEPDKSEPSASRRAERARAPAPPAKVPEKAQAPPAGTKPATARADKAAQRRRQRRFQGASSAAAARAVRAARDHSGARVAGRKARATADPAAPVVVDVRRQGEALRLTFPFVVPTPAAVFRRADTIWLVFDSQAPIDINKITAQSGRSIRNATVTRSREGQVIQLKLDKPKLTSIGAEGLTWTVVVGDTMLEPTQPLGMVRVAQGGATCERHHSVRRAVAASSSCRRRDRRHACWS